ncbi:hypothetical protein SAMN05216464_106210 [Mucilaginibacter pineti]|uniref:Uncharacterized protein n=1 Tax=Mucilaginibacter pineti TaxID=1391627 RepID=A0A1G7D2B1_9SPHI|nr:hypothetical protein [Mucilaginibacter pineti]SDE45732.1 hypothetical protein SAMN05216464_106210 [Mucilaginibacter pineti]
MKIKRHIQKETPIELDVVEEKIEKYLKKNFYRITERGPGFVIFIEDELSNRKRSRSDYHTRIGEGKFVFDYSADQDTIVELIYLTDISYNVFLATLVCAFGIYVNHIVMPIVMSLALTLPVFFKIIYLNGHVFEEILEC